jgi:hypothetical protein
LQQAHLRCLNRGGPAKEHDHIARLKLRLGPGLVGANATPAQ